MPFLVQYHNHFLFIIKVMNLVVEEGVGGGKRVCTGLDAFFVVYHDYNRSY